MNLTIVSLVRTIRVVSTRYLRYCMKPESVHLVAL